MVRGRPVVSNPLLLLMLLARVGAVTGRFVRLLAAREQTGDAGRCVLLRILLLSRLNGALKLRQVNVR